MSRQMIDGLIIVALLALAATHLVMKERTQRTLRPQTIAEETFHHPSLRISAAAAPSAYVRLR
jgi:hypothetical protein